MGKLPMKNRTGSWTWQGPFLIDAEHLLLNYIVKYIVFPFVRMQPSRGIVSGLCPTSTFLAVSAVRGTLRWSQL